MTPRERAERVLGKAVHPQALDRLFEIWPEAIVTVKHDEVPRGVGPDFGARLWLRRTVVDILQRKGAEKTTGHVARNAYCHSSDQFNRKTGINLAFRRALREVVNRGPMR